MASPEPVDIVELSAIKQLHDSGTIVICTGGGGVPVIKNEYGYEGVNAVIDKDLASSLLARKLNADMLVILTDVENVFLDYGTENQKALSTVSAEECSAYMEMGQFGEGTMKPKVEAAIRFVEGTGKPAVVTSLANAEKAVELRAGTIITK